MTKKITTKSLMIAKKTFSIHVLVCVSSMYILKQLPLLSIRVIIWVFICFKNSCNGNRVIYIQEYQTNFIRRQCMTYPVKEPDLLKGFIQKFTEKSMKIIHKLETMLMAVCMYKSICWLPKEQIGC